MTYPPRIACVASSSQRAQAAQAELASRNDLVAPEDCTVIVALGGDGLLLHTAHEHLGAPDHDLPIAHQLQRRGSGSVAGDRAPSSRTAASGRACAQEEHGRETTRSGSAGAARSRQRLWAFLSSHR